MYRLRPFVLFVVQAVVLRLSYAWHRLVRGRRGEDIGWIVGPYEIASMVHHLAAAVPTARSAILQRHPFYAFEYDWQPSTRLYPGATVLRAWLYGPALLGQLAARSRGFIYVSAEGFLHAGRDQRLHEFRFLRARGRRIVCYFTGSDIRSPRLMKQLELETGVPNIATYLPDVNPIFGTVEYDEARRRVANSANLYADTIFNADVDQRGYLVRPSEPFLYFHPDEAVADDLSKFDSIERPIVVHAPSSPIIKGTPLVRAAVAKLREEGYDFEYIELIGVSHAVVTDVLSRAHISLNEFYAFVPGVFGVESMAAGCALLTAADERIETQLPAGSNSAWSVTPHHRIAENLRALLDDPAAMRHLAEAGRDWVRAHAITSVSGERLAAALSRGQMPRSGAAAPRQPA